MTETANEVKRSDDVKYVRRQYETDSNLAVRIRTHELYGVPRIDFAAWVLNHVDWRGDELVLDVGCGAGVYVRAARRRAGAYIAADLSLGMLRALPEQPVPSVNLDAQQLPIASGAVDVLLANHMLYHVPDRDRALKEFVRALRPGGVLLAATNSESNMSEFATLRQEAAAAAGVDLKAPPLPTLTFTLENGAALLERYFSRVQRHDLPGALLFPQAQPVIDYLASSRERFEEQLPPEITWDDIARSLRAILERHLASEDVYRVNKLTGVFVCHNE
jgi:SAM-dependent methyltransferase